MRPQVQMLAALLVTSGCDLASGASDGGQEAACQDVRSPARRRLAITHFHGDARRHGWNEREAELSPERVAQGLVEVWSSRQLDRERIDGVEYEPLVYATPLYVDGAWVEVPEHGPVQLDLVVTATSNGWVYGVHAGSQAQCGVEPGQILWANRVVDPEPLERLDGGVPMGVLSTPVIDLEAIPALVYVSAHDREEGWQVFALELGTGRVMPGWPVTLDAETVESVNTNPSAAFLDATQESQRGALQLSPTGHRVYASFGTYWGEGVGWLVAVDTRSPKVAASFSAAASQDDRSNGGMWGSAGPAIDEYGRVWVTAGNSPGDSRTTPGTWGSSLLQLSADLELQRHYTPFNYCTLDEANMDLGASQPLLLPPLHHAATPNTIAFGGKQGTVYLVDANSLADAGEGRPQCGDDAASDGSLLPPESQPQYGSRGPLNVFGPYSDEYGQIDHAKMRTKLAYWRDPEGTPFLFATGSTKAAEDSTVNVAPSIAKLRVAHEHGGPAWLEVDTVEPSVVFHNPGSPVVSSWGHDEGVVWVIDRNAPRTASLLDPSTANPVLYAFDAETLELLWRSPDDALGPAGKYASPIVVHGQVIVATDRIQAIALR